MGYQVYEDRAARDLGVTRWAGYGVPAKCDHPECDAVIDRGLGYRCEAGCGLSFCTHHLLINPQQCARCDEGKEPFAPKPDIPEWEKWMLTDESWQQWRDEHPGEVAAMEARQGGTEGNDR